MGLPSTYAATSGYCMGDFCAISLYWAIYSISEVCLVRHRTLWHEFRQYRPTNGRNLEVTSRLFGPHISFLVEFDVCSWCNKYFSVSSAPPLSVSHIANGRADIARGDWAIPGVHTKHRYLPSRQWQNRFYIGCVNRAAYWSPPLPIKIQFEDVKRVMRIDKTDSVTLPELGSVHHAV